MWRTGARSRRATRRSYLVRLIGTGSCARLLETFGSEGRKQNNPYPQKHFWGATSRPRPRPIRSERSATPRALDGCRGCKPRLLWVAGIAVWNERAMGGKRASEASLTATSHRHPKQPGVERVLAVQDPAPRSRSGKTAYSYNQNQHCISRPEGGSEVVSEGAGEAFRQSVRLCHKPCIPPSSRRARRQVTPAVARLSRVA